MQVVALPTGGAVPLQTKTLPTITAAAAAVLVTDSLTHLPPWTPAPFPKNNCRVHLHWQGLPVAAWGGGKCQVPAPTMVGPYRAYSHACYLILMLYIMAVRLSVSENVCC